MIDPDLSQEVGRLDRDYWVACEALRCDDDANCPAAVARIPV